MQADQEQDQSAVLPLWREVPVMLQEAQVPALREAQGPDIMERLREWVLRLLVDMRRGQGSWGGFLVVEVLGEVLGRRGRGRLREEGMLFERWNRSHGTFVGFLCA